VIVGSKDGHLLLIETASGSIIQDLPAHANTIWSLHSSRETASIVTGSADKTVKFWDFKSGKFTGVAVDHTVTAASAVLEHSATLKLSDDVLAVLTSPNSKYVAAALLDSTIKIFYKDTLKFYLSLYGHKVLICFV
jgi:U3 small nucleolar RNA-associated protein 12